MTALWMRLVPVAAVAGVLGWFGGVASGQEARRLEPGVGDTGGLAVSVRSLPVGFRGDTGFEHVYEGKGGRVYRVAGAIHAVYDRGVYDRGGAGRPAGQLTYWIGEPDWSLYGGEGSEGDAEERDAAPTGERVSAARASVEPVRSRLLPGNQTGVAPRGSRAGTRKLNEDEVGLGTMSEGLTRVRRLVEIARAYR